MSFCVRVVAPDEALLFEGSYSDGEQVLLSDVLTKAGLHQDRPCNGRGVCGKCAVRAIGELSPMTDAEAARLSQQQMQTGIRLACVARAVGTATIYYNIDQANMQGLTTGFFTNFLIKFITSPQYNYIIYRCFNKEQLLLCPITSSAYDTTTY